MGLKNVMPDFLHPAKSYMDKNGINFEYYEERDDSGFKIFANKNRSKVILKQNKNGYVEIWKDFKWIGVE